MKEASFYEKMNDKKVKCVLCPNNCILNNVQTGKCRVRKNIEGILYSRVYGKISALNIDPIEKKPFYHYMPGKKVATIGSYGCNLSCTYCQNYQISQTAGDDAEYENMLPEIIAEKIRGIENNIGVAFSYNEPTVFYEYMRDIAVLVKKMGMKTLMITNGYINREPLLESFNFIDAYSIDLKGFNEKFYSNICGGILEPVKETIKACVKNGKHVEIENLIINENSGDMAEFEEMAKWIAMECSADVPLHLNMYHPAYKMSAMPVTIGKLEQMREIAMKYLNFVYIGNTVEKKYSETICPQCGKISVTRDGYNRIINAGCNEKGECVSCGRKIFVG